MRPDLRYTVGHLLNGFKLQTSELKLVGQVKGDSKKAVEENYKVSFPKPSENIVVTELKKRGNYKTTLGLGKHDITCPWVEEHTNAVNGGTAYFEPNDIYPIGGFKCLHGHCASRSIKDLVSFLNVSIKSAKMKPTIRLIKGEIHQVVNAAERELASTGLYYQRGGQIVTIVTDPFTKETHIDVCSSPSLVQALSAAALWEVPKENGNFVIVDPPQRPVNILHDLSIYNHLPILSGLARQPFLREDNSVCSQSGYDELSMIFGIFNEKKYKITANPTKQDALESLKVIQELIQEFPFNNQVDESATLSAILTAVLRPTLPQAPMIHVMAHQVGTGKSYLCDVIASFASSVINPPSTFPKDEEECRKFLLSELMRGPAVITFDNLTTDLLPHKTLCIVLTSESIRDRILGLSKTASAGTRTLFLSSGNNVGPIADMTRRTITINLDANCETPASREFKRPHLLREIMMQREKYVSAALTVVLAWISAGRPRTEVPALAGFQEWSDLCRQPLLWLGCADPAKSIFEAITTDPERDLLGALIKTWHNSFADKSMMLRQALESANPSGSEAGKELYEVMMEIAGERGEINRRILGRWMKRNTGRIIDGQKLLLAPGVRSAQAWYVKSVI